MSFVIFETINNSMKNYHLARIEFLQSTSYTMPQEISSLRRRINNRDGNEEKKKKRKGEKEKGNWKFSLSLINSYFRFHRASCQPTNPCKQKREKIKEKGEKC